MLVVGDLVLKQQQDHADGNDVLGQVPGLVFQSDGGSPGIEHGGHDEDTCPAEEAQDADQRARSSAVVHVNKVESARDVNREEARVKGHFSMATAVLNGD